MKRRITREQNIHSILLGRILSRNEDEIIMGVGRESGGREREGGERERGAGGGKERESPSGRER